LRQALIGAWRLVSIEQDIDGRLVKPFGDNPLCYPVYTADGHVVVQFASRDRIPLFVPRPGRGPVLAETTEADTALGFAGYCGTFKVRDGQLIHHTEFHVAPYWDGRVETRAPTLDGDRLMLRTPRGQQLEWHRVY
jgi:hypothetical protein